MKQDVQKIVSVMAADFHGPAGPIPFERLLRKHHRLLADLRERGLTWEQVSRLLAGSGIKRCSGLAFPASHLRGVFGRHRSRMSESTYRKRSIGSATITNVGLSSQEASDTGRRNAGSRGFCSGMVVCEALANPRDLTDEPRSGDGAAIGGSTPDSRAQALAVMRQSVRARRVAE